MTSKSERSRVRSFFASNTVERTANTICDDESTALHSGRPSHHNGSTISSPRKRTSENTGTDAAGPGCEVDSQSKTVLLWPTYPCKAWNKRYVERVALESCMQESCAYCTMLLEGISCIIEEPWTTCSLLFSSFNTSSPEEETLNWDAPEVELFYKTNAPQQSDHPILHWDNTGLPSFTVTLAHLDIDALDDFNGSFGDTGGDISLARTLSWLEECMHTHAECGMTAEPSLPHRVLNLDPLDSITGDVKLVELKANISGQYACLSYCWGSSMPYKTTTRNIAIHKRGIPYKKLPKTFRDAISFCRKLRIRWLWIDSLCILQDDENDWRHEAASMADIYANAVITLAASKSANSSEGLYNSGRLVDTKRFCQIHSSGHLYTMYARRYQRIEHVSAKNFSLQQDVFPLLSRGWAYQERILSPRVLHFGPKELQFECRYLQCECGERNSFGASPSEHRNRWETICMGYAQRVLSFTKDTLPAIAGVAKRFSKVKRGRYLAGLWEDDLIPGLTWTLAGKRSNIRPDPRLPSWSWASNMPGATIATGKPKISKVQATVHDIVYITVGEDPFGEIEYAHLDIESDVIPALFNWEMLQHQKAPNEMYRGGRLKEELYQPAELEIGLVHADAWSHSLSLETAPLEVMLLSLVIGNHHVQFIDDPNDRDQEIFLILIKADNCGEKYKRIGLCQAWNISYATTRLRRTIRLL